MYALNTATLSTRTHLAPKPWITFRGHSSRRGTAYYCIIMWSLESEMSNERSEHIRFLEPHCHSAPLSRKPCEYLHKCYTLETTFICLHFRRWLCGCVRLSSFVFFWRARKSNARSKTASVVVKDLRFKDEDKDKESSFKDKDKDLMSKDEDFKIGPRGQGLSPRTTL